MRKLSFHSPSATWSFVLNLQQNLVNLLKQNLALRRDFILKNQRCFRFYVPLLDFFMEENPFVTATDTKVSMKKEQWTLKLWIKEAIEIKIGQYLKQSFITEG